ncbi:MAG: exodeoxyribonuclease VII large subunit, partial [Actinomycetota bacterium]
MPPVEPDNEFEGDPDRPSGPATDPRADSTLTVSQLCAQVDGAIEQAFPDEVWVQGAISSLSRSANGHAYFDLVEPTGEMGASTGATVPVALFASTRTLVNRILRKAGGVRMHDGIEIRIRGRVAYY